MGAARPNLPRSDPSWDISGPPERRATVLLVASLDLTGIVITIAAATVLALHDEADSRWWSVVGLAVLISVFTTVVVIRAWEQRRSFITASLRLAEYLEDLAKGGANDPEEWGDLLRVAHRRRFMARASDDVAVVDRLTVALAKSPPAIAQAARTLQ
jgi:hypothetical protein